MPSVAGDGDLLVRQPPRAVSALVDLARRQQWFLLPLAALLLLTLLLLGLTEGLGVAAPFIYTVF